MAYVWLTPTRHQEAAVGDWYQRPDGEWVHDENAPSPGNNPAVTQIFNAVTYPEVHEPTDPAPSGFQTDDGSWYARVDPAEFPEDTP